MDTEAKPPYFFFDGEAGKGEEIVLPEDSSRHILSVLRMQSGDALCLVNGHGTLMLAELAGVLRKQASVRITGITREPRQSAMVTLAISILKQPARFEWMLEKVTELGVGRVIPLVCQRTERQRFRQDRMKQIMITAMVQSQQLWLPELQEPVPFEAALGAATDGLRLIAHCYKGNKTELKHYLQKSEDCILFIGPEGDFTVGEIEAAMHAGFRPVSLGDTRLRTETAGVAAVTLLRLS